MLRWSRRQLLAALSSLPVAGLAACARDRRRVEFLQRTGPARLIDAHCHIFNVTDLPAATFARIVLLRQYEHEGPPTYFERKLAAALQALETIAARGVVTADQEASGGAGAPLIGATERALTPAERREIRRQEAAAAEALDALDKMAGPGLLGDCDGGGFPRVSPRSISNWVQSLRSRRGRLARTLVNAHGRSGYSTALLTPALVDYSNWLGQDLKSPLPDQVRAMGALARDPSGPPVHAYFPFDPLRRALVRENRPVRDGGWDPRDVLRDALTNHGFIGVKLYPPMGYRASGNTAGQQPFPPSVRNAFGDDEKTAAALDTSLDELWPLCLELDAPIMAHAANSNAAGRCFGRRADPTYWLPVALKHPQLRIMLAHFGRFRTPAGTALVEDDDDIPFEQSWEGVIGKFVADHPSSMLFADISFFSELFRRRERARALERMQRYLKLDPGGRHLVFGSDWVMLGVARDFVSGGGYATRVKDFLADAGLNDEQIDGVMYGNAVRFLGLDEGSKARSRLLRFYAANGLPPERLPS